MSNTLEIYINGVKKSTELPQKDNEKDNEKNQVSIYVDGVEYAPVTKGSEHSKEEKQKEETKGSGGGGCSCKWWEFCGCETRKNSQVSTDLPSWEICPPWENPATWVRPSRRL